MAAEYKFKNSRGVVITTKDASAANEMRLSPNFTEVKDEKATTKSESKPKS